MNMEDKIIKELSRIEEEKPIHLVNARERGSRMLGVAHDDSDWDVLFLFAQDAARYATIHGRVDSIHEPHLGEDDEIDLHGWNVDKFAQLARDSNPNAVEYCREDPTEYITMHDGGRTFEALAENVREHFNHMSLYHHYISMAKSNWAKYVKTGNDPTKGRQFYVVRAIAMAQHIREAGEMPPLDAFELAGSDALSTEVSSTLHEMATAKIGGAKDAECEDKVGHLYEQESALPMEPEEARIDSPDDEVLDAFIIESVVK